jgi:hypothetical protein
MTQKFLKDKNFSAATIFFQGKKNKHRRKTLHQN